MKAIGLNEIVGLIYRECRCADERVYLSYSLIRFGERHTSFSEKQKQTNKQTNKQEDKKQRNCMNSAHWALWFDCRTRRRKKNERLTKRKRKIALDNKQHDDACSHFVGPRFFPPHAPMPPPFESLLGT
jgi:ATPase subunit of ABC transporter with duplicated ATPase domains